MLVFFFILGALTAAIFIFYILWHYLVSLPAKTVFLVIEEDVPNIEWLMRQALHCGRLRIAVVDRAGGGEGSLILEKLSRSYDFILTDILPAGAENVFYINKRTSVFILKKQLQEIAENKTAKGRKNKSADMG